MTSTGPSGRRQGRRDVDRAVGTSTGPSGRRQGRRDVDRAVGTSTGPSGRRQGRRDVDRAVGTSTGPSGRRQGRRDVDRAVGTPPRAPQIVGVGRDDHLLTLPHHGACGRQHIYMGIITLTWASAR